MSRSMLFMPGNPKTLYQKVVIASPLLFYDLKSYLHVAQSERVQILTNLKPHMLPAIVSKKFCGVRESDSCLSLSTLN